MSRKGGSVKDGIRLSLTRDPELLGHSDEWRAKADTFLDGVGKTRTDAVGKFFMANLDRFGVVSLVDTDPNSPNVEVVWEEGSWGVGPYKGHHGVCKFDRDADVYRGSVSGIDDTVTFQGASRNQAVLEFRKSVDDYLAFISDRK
jgi:hypothetical protein